MNEDEDALDPRLLDLTGTIKPSRHDKVCFICPEIKTGEWKRREFQRRGFDNVFVTWPGDSIMGRRFSTVILSSETYELIHLDDRSIQWWNESLRCRLTEHGQIIVIP